MTKYKMNLKRFIPPGALWLAGLVLIVIYAPKTVYINGMVGLGFLLLCVSSIWMLIVIYQEYDKADKGLPLFLDSIFSEYPVVADKNDFMKQLGGFRTGYSEFLSGTGAEQNSSLQNYTTQLMWHGIALQKGRLEKNGLTLEMDSQRRAYSGVNYCVRENRYFDGRYRVADVYEEISALRTIRSKDAIIKIIKDNEVAHYTMLSANQAGGGKVICPNCGNPTTRENLLDGCDYCDTKFTVEDMENKIDSFGLRRDFRTNASKKEALKSLLLPWVTLILMLPLIYFGFIGAFVYTQNAGFFMKLITGILAAGLLGLLGWALARLSMVIVVPIMAVISASWKSFNRKMIYSRKQKEDQEKAMSERVRRYDPHFSIQSFFGGVQNKLSAIHYADSEPQINAFSENDMTPFIRKYANVVDVDFLEITLDDYRADEELQTASVEAELRLMELKGGRIGEREEKVRMTMIKSADCKTQAVCGASVLKCKSCGASLSLMEGKTCGYCGRELDLKLYDWVISKYETV